MNRREAFKATLGVAALGGLAWFSSVEEAEASPVIGGTMVLTEGEDPKVYNHEGKEVTNDCHKVEIFPGRIAWAHLYARNKDGLIYLDTNGQPADAEPVLISKIVGTWRSRRS